MAPFSAGAETGPSGESSARDRGGAPSGSPLQASVSVDSSAPGYSATVLTDNKWFEKGQEDPRERGPSRLGNAGNTWVSGETPTEHWIRLDWPAPVALDELIIWWSLADWFPRAFRVEQLRAISGCPSGLMRVGWRPRIDSQSYRCPRSSPSRFACCSPGPAAARAPADGRPGIMAWNRAGATRPLRGARRLSPTFYARLTPKPLARNIARLDQDSPARQLQWPGGRTKTAIVFRRLQMTTSRSRPPSLAPMLPSASNGRLPT